MFRLAVVLLYTAGLRRGELVRLVLSDYDPVERTLLMRASKFHKSRLVALSADAAREMEAYLRARRRLPHDADAPLLVSRPEGCAPRSGTGLGAGLRRLFRRAGVAHRDRALPRASTTCATPTPSTSLLRWYRAGADVQAKLPALATSMGHVSIVSTAYYLALLDPVAEAASERFARHCAALLLAASGRGGRRDERRAAQRPRPRAAWLLRRSPAQGPRRQPPHRPQLPRRLRAPAALPRGASQAVRSSLLDFDDLAPEDVLAFLDHLETERRNGAATRNARLAAIHAFARYVATRTPSTSSAASGSSPSPSSAPAPRRRVPREPTRSARSSTPPTARPPQGRRDHALLLALFNTGARVQEILDVRPCDLQLVRPLQVRLRGKGRKERLCPLWPQTAEILRALLAETGIDPAATQPLFRNRRGEPLTRFGVRYLLRKYARVARSAAPTLAAKRVHPHTLRHTTAVHLLQAGVDLVTISHWLGHASVETTNRYAAVDLEMKRAALAKARPLGDIDPALAAWRSDASILEWLEAL